MATTLIGWRPSPLPAACPSIVSLTLPTAQAHVLGQAAVRTAVPTEPQFGPGRSATSVARYAAVKINNYIGAQNVAPAQGAAAEGTTTSSLSMAAGALRNQQIDADKVKGEDARGIPPRERRKV